MSDILMIKDLPINSKKVLMRVDFNVPVDQDGKISDDARIKAALPSIQWVLDHGGSLILMSHLGRPKEPSLKDSLYPVALRLSELLNKDVTFVGGSRGTEVKEKVSQMQPGDVVLLENLRFEAAEEKPEIDPQYAKDLASLADIYIDDAFGSAHRAHTSITEVPKLFGKMKGAGLLLSREVEFLDKTLKTPARPFVAIIGGSKISSKIGVIEALEKKADTLLIGGAMAFTLLKSQGVKVGNSLVEEDVKLPKLTNTLLPLDFVCEKEGELKTFTVDEGIPDGWKGLDIGPLTLEKFKSEIDQAKTLFWNGPMGLFEDPRFAKGTEVLLKALADSSATTIVGGGDSLLAVKNCGLESKITHLSTGGGASLEYIEFGTLPGIEVLKL